MATSYDRARRRSETTVRAEHLLARYPNLSEQELADLIHLFPHVNMVARGLMAADDGMGPKVEHFYRDHGKELDEFGGGKTTLIIVASLAAIVIGFNLI